LADDQGTTFVFKGDTSQAESSVDQFGDKIMSVGKTAGLAFAAFFAADKLVSFFNESTKAAIESEAAVREFNSTLVAANVFTEQLSQSFQDYAQSLQDATGVQDEVILKGAKTLIEIGNLSGQQLNNTIVAGLNLAAARGIDAASAFEMLARAANGNVMPFTKMGIKFEENATGAQKLNTVLGFINEKWSTAAADKMKGYEGAVKRLSNTWGDLLENFGKTTTQSSLAIGTLKVLNDALISTQVYASQTWGMIQKMGSALIFLSSAIQAYVVTMIELDGKGPIRMKQAFEAYKTSIAETNAGLTTFENISKRIAETPLLPPPPPPINIGKSNAEIDEWIEKHNQLLKDSATTFANYKSGFISGLTEIAGSAKSLGRTMSSTLVNGFTSAFAGIGKSLVSGKNSFNEFGKSMLSMLGTLCIQIGQFLVLAGLGFAALPIGFSGFGAIAAGLGLIVLGGVLQALGGGGETPASSGVGSTSSDGTLNGGSPSFDEQTKEEERAKAQTGITVVVQGNIFDSRETGIQIAQIIADSFDINGTQIRGYA